jgi:hypothetical protein
MPGGKKEKLTRSGIVAAIETGALELIGFCEYMSAKPPKKEVVECVGKLRNLQHTLHQLEEEITPVPPDDVDLSTKGFSDSLLLAIYKMDDGDDKSIKLVDQTLRKMHNPKLRKFFTQLDACVQEDFITTGTYQVEFSDGWREITLSAC